MRRRFLVCSREREESCNCRRQEPEQLGQHLGEALLQKQQQGSQQEQYQHQQQVAHLLLQKREKEVLQLLLLLSSNSASKGRSSGYSRCTVTIRAAALATAASSVLHGRGKGVLLHVRFPLAAAYDPQLSFLHSSCWGRASRQCCCSHYVRRKVAAAAAAVVAAAVVAAVVVVAAAVAVAAVVAAWWTVLKRRCAAVTGAAE